MGYSRISLVKNKIFGEKCKMKNCALIVCDDSYVPISIVALKCFIHKNPDYDCVIIGTTFENSTKELCIDHHVKLIEIDLNNDFTNLNARPYGAEYPIECFYHFYAYKVLQDYDYIVKIESDIYTNKSIDFNISQVECVAGSYTVGNKINNFMPLMNDLDKIKSIYKHPDTDQYRVCGGVIIYNVKNLGAINFYEKILEYYVNSFKIGAPRCGDDSLMVMYQMLNKKNVKLLNPEFHVIFPKVRWERVKFLFGFGNDSYVDDIYHFHFGGPQKKYWVKTPSRKYVDKYFADKMIDYIHNHFDPEFIEQYIPTIYSGANSQS